MRVAVGYELPAPLLGATPLTMLLWTLGLQLTRTEGYKVATPNAHAMPARAHHSKARMAED